MNEKECTVCGMPIDDLEQGTGAEEAAYDAGLCMTDFEALDFSVGLANESGSVLGRFATEQEASEFISTLEGREDGRYYLDGPPN